MKLKAHTGDFEAIRQYYSLPVDTRTRNALFRYLATHVYMQSYLVALAEEILVQFAQCHNDPVVKLDFLDDTRLSIIIDAEVMSTEADARLSAMSDWCDSALTHMGALHIDTE